MAKDSVLDSLLYTFFAGNLTHPMAAYGDDFQTFVEKRLNTMTPAALFG